MKTVLKFRVVLAALLMTMFLNSYAQQSADVKATMERIVKKHDGSKGVSCMTVAKGSGLELLKVMLNREFGKEFMKGVTSVTLLDYSKASQEICMALHNDINSFTSLLQEFDLSKEEQFSGYDHIRCFASESEDGTLSDFIIALEDAKTKMLVYMVGKIKVE